VNNINNINYNCSNLQYGEIICLGSVGADCQTTHVVGSGDTCDSIASVAGINTTMLNLNNPQIDADCTNVYIGEVRISTVGVTARILLKHAISSGNRFFARLGACWSPQFPQAPNPFRPRPRPQLTTTTSHTATSSKMLPATLPK
jgi:hypothetical protein